MKKLRINWAGILALTIALGIVSYCNGREVENSKTDLEQRIEEFQQQPYIKLNTDSPTGFMVESGELTETEETWTQETSHSK